MHALAAQTPLGAAEIDAFVRNGYVRIDAAFPEALARAALSILWRATACDPADPATWTRPVIRLGMFTDSALVEAANTAVLRAAFDQLAGPGRWSPCRAMGTAPVRFPGGADPGDAGWHVGASFGYDDPDFLNWRVNHRSDGRALLMLFLFSEVGPEDAPTRLRIGSHLDMARRLAPAGGAGLSLRDLAASGFAETAHRPEALATGPPGTVYLCHPFLVHAAQPHRGRRPRFLAQPPLLPPPGAGPGDPGGAAHPVGRAIEVALRTAPGPHGSPR